MTSFYDDDDNQVL